MNYRPPETSEQREQRFWSKVEPEPNSGCWLWLGSLNTGGYGLFSVDGSSIKAHRRSWEMTHGPIPPGEGYHGTCVLHKCDVRSCVNPRHLFLGTNGDNVRDRESKGRNHMTGTRPSESVTHCRRGHEYSPDNAYINDGKRYCKECHRRRNRNYAMRKRKERHLPEYEPTP